MITRIELHQYRRMTDHHRRSPEARAFRRRLDAALAELPAEQQKLMVLRYCLRLSWIAVSMRMHCSEATCRRMDRRIRKMWEEAR